MCNVVTYHSVNTKAGSEWLGYPVQSDGSVLWVRFEAADEASVISRVKTWYASERARQARLAGPDAATLVATPSQNRTSDNPIKTGRGVIFAGKVWMLNRTTGERARVDVDQVGSYEMNGFVKGGPRSK